MGASVVGTSVVGTSVVGASVADASVTTTGAANKARIQNLNMMLGSCKKSINFSRQLEPVQT